MTTGFFMTRRCLDELIPTLKLSLPMIVGSLGQSLLGFTDNLMVAKLGVVPLAAAAFVNNLVSTAMVFLIGCASAIAVYVAEAYGARQPKTTGQYFYQGLLTVMAITVAV